MLTDAGPLVAMIDQKDADHARCLAAATALRRPMVTTWPCFAEAMYLLGRGGGHRDQIMLWQMYLGGRLEFHVNGAAETTRMAGLMRQYRNVPMDLADASLVAAADARGERRVFTIDSDFVVYRRADGSPFVLLPA